VKYIILLALLLNFTANAAEISNSARSVADYAAEKYSSAMIDSLAELVKHNTVKIDGISSIDNANHQAFKQALKKQALALGFDFQDKGYVIIVGFGDSKNRLGLITHGDVQPADIKKWSKSPFELDTTSEPGRLVGRGTLDDKGSISNALYAMKAIKDNKIKLSKRIELYVYMAEESDWEPLKEFIKHNSLPAVNITLDADYPVVIAEKAYGTISLSFPNSAISGDSLYLKSFTGGFFGSQIPEDAYVLIAGANADIEKKLRQRAKQHHGMKYKFSREGKDLTIKALGKTAHSSKPETGVNAISHLADLISLQRWPNNAAGALVNFINDHLGTTLYGEKFGDIAYQDDFMGPMTVAATVLKQQEDGINLAINIRRPKGKTARQLDDEINHVLQQWQQENKVNLFALNNKITEPFVQTKAPQIETLLSVYGHYTGQKEVKPISIGGGTNSRMFPNAVSFGPAMPNAEYTAHTEHEYITLEHFILNLKMYTAALIELAK